MTELGTGTSIHDRITQMSESTYSDAVIRSNAAAALFSPDLSGMEQPVFVSAACSVGPKLQIAHMLDRHESVAHDCVALCSNDIACVGAKPLYFMAYAAGEKSDDGRLEQVVVGITDACRRVGCAFLGGNRMEKAAIYADGRYDLSGFAVGVCDKKDLIDGHDIQPGDVLIGLASSGIHNEGFDIVSEVFEITPRTLNRHVGELSCSLGEALLKPCSLYSDTVQYLTRRMHMPIKGMAHIAAGGLFANVPRMLPEGVRAHITPSTFPIPAIFDLISQKGSIPLDQMFHTFNMGTGFVLAVSKNDAGAVYSALVQAGERPYMAGYCSEGEKGVDIAWQGLHM